MSKREIAFLSYASEDEAFIWRIHDGLTKRNVEVWFDKKNLGIGKWKPQIEKAIAHSRYFVFCLSRASLRKTSLEEPGFADQELQTAWEIARNQPESEFTIVPVRLEACDRGDHRLSVHNQYDLYEDDNFELTLDKLAVNLGGISISDSKIDNNRTEEEKFIVGLLGKSMSAYFSGEYLLALKLADSIIELKPENYEAWHHKGLTLYELGRKDDAIVAFDKVVTLNPQDYGAWYNKCVIFFEVGRTDEGFDACDRTIEIFFNFTKFPKDGTITEDPIVKHKKASKIISELISMYEEQVSIFTKQIAEAHTNYQNDVEIWSSYAQDDSVLGHYSESMSEYYDNEVRVSHQYYQQIERKLHDKIEGIQAKMRPIRERIERLKEIERSFK